MRVVILNIMSDYATEYDGNDPVYGRINQRYKLGAHTGTIIHGIHLYKLLDNGAPTSATCSSQVIRSIYDACEITGGIFCYGEFYGGEYYGGEFYAGTYYGGEFHSGTFNSGTFYNGCFAKCVVSYAELQNHTANTYNGGVYYGGENHSGALGDERYAGWSRI